MLIVSLIISCALLYCVNRKLARSPNPLPRVLLYLLGFAFLPFGFLFFSPPVLLQAGLMFALILVLRVPHKNRRLYLPLSCIATVVAYGVASQSVVKEQLQLAQLRQQYPYESLEERLPLRSNGQSFPLVASLRLQSFENEYDHKILWDGYTRRTALQELHEQSVMQFVNNQGFGATRMPYMNIPRDLKAPLPDRPAIQQPDYLQPYLPPDDALTATPQGWDSTRMLQTHDAGVFDFVNPKGFGYAKDRGHVAGFQSHGMSKAPASQIAWSIAHLDLLGVVVHDQPVVYVTGNLPQMREVGSIPTRALNTFEQEGLKQLREGEDLFVRAGKDGGRMLGAIRTTKQCLTCHGGSRGDLLGAFTYILRRDDR